MFIMPWYVIARVVEEEECKKPASEPEIEKED